MADALLNAALTAYKAGTLDELLAARGGVTRWIGRRFLRPVLGAGGDVLREPHALTQAVEWSLRWVAIQLRPDRRADLADIDRAAWLERTSWRPVLAVLCHYGFLAVPDFTDRYRRRVDESAADNLCGLWSVGPSTFYRYLDKGKRLMAKILAGPPMGGELRLSLRRSIEGHLGQRLGWSSPDEAAAWHARQVEELLARRDHGSGLWHLIQARDGAAVTRCIHRFRVELASDRETDVLLEWFSAQALTPRQCFDLHLAQATLWRTRNLQEREYQAYQQALAIAAPSDDKVMLGIVYGVLGKFHEPRDTDKAFACFEDSAEFLRQALDGTGAADDETLQAYVVALVKLAGFYVLRNDPRSRPVLDRIETLRVTSSIAASTVASIELTWGEYRRRAGELSRAVEHVHRALNISERLGDTRQCLATYTVLSVLYLEAKEYERSIQALQHVLTLADQFSGRTRDLRSVPE